MTLDEIAYNLRNLIRGGISNQDEEISLEQIKFNVRHYRAMFIRRDFARNNYISNHIEHCSTLLFQDLVYCIENT